MGTGSSRQVCSLKDRPQTWSLKYVPEDIINQLAEIIGTKARCDDEIIKEMKNLLGMRYTETVTGTHTEVAKKLLLKMREKDVCRKTWCDHHRDHLWRENEPRCYTTGGLQLFFKRRDLKNAAKLFDENREKIEKFYFSKQYPNFIVHGWCAFCNFLQRCSQRSSLKNLHVMADLNSLGPRYTCIVVMLLKQTEFVTTPFVIPRRPRGQFLAAQANEWTCWRNFVKRQIESMGPGAVLIMKYSKMLLDAAEQATADTNDNVPLDSMEVRCKTDAIKFIWRCAIRYRITLIGVRPERGNMYEDYDDIEENNEELEEDGMEEDSDEDDEQEEEGNEEAAEEVEERIAKVFSLGCYRLPGEESNFAECLLMCAYLAKKQPSSWSRPARGNA